MKIILGQKEKKIMKIIRRIIKVFFKGLMPFLFVLLIITTIFSFLYAVYQVSPIASYIIGETVLVIIIYLMGEYMEN